MKLRDLDAQLIQWTQSGAQVLIPHVNSLSDAHGVLFECPKCHGTGRDHSIICWFERRVPDSAAPKPGRWVPQGTSLDDLSFVPGQHSHSVLLLEGCRWHGFVKNGEATLS